MTYQDYQATVGEDAITLRRGDTITLDPLVTITVISSGGVVIGETWGLTGGTRGVSVTPPRQPRRASVQHGHRNSQRQHEQQLRGD